MDASIGPRSRAAGRAQPSPPINWLPGTGQCLVWRDSHGYGPVTDPEVRMTMMSGGELLAATLRAAGVDVVFALHGGHLNPFLVGCRTQGIDLVDGRHE